ncbi:uncharacterized protein N7515_002315 [Penicillium bovifimosum]|uniref:Uncharacterized protein n=1 Tax=Penicillium bovifimosum TaxID=126998 RepID=A0A9W9HDE2_9EURO|nr:uncharacterized protein N7515_002315 [Penicillium bovifimosum]KAJ5143528.1 hypothetical protein N7515_002315 [Penicillium bovifimosum]
MASSHQPAAPISLTTPPAQSPPTQTSPVQENPTAADQNPRPRQDTKRVLTANASGISNHLQWTMIPLHSTNSLISSPSNSGSGLGAIEIQHPADEHRRFTVASMA